MATKVRSRARSAASGLTSNCPGAGAAAVGEAGAMGGAGVAVVDGGVACAVCSGAKEAAVAEDGAGVDEVATAGTIFDGEAGRLAACLVTCRSSFLDAARQTLDQRVPLANFLLEFLDAGFCCGAWVCRLSQRRRRDH